MLNDAIIAALKAELEGYVRRGLHHRADQVIAQLAALGCSDILSTRPSGTLPPEGGTPKPAAKKAPKVKVTVEADPADISETVMSTLKKARKK
jgi:hypothetical protein